MSRIAGGVGRRLSGAVLRYIGTPYQRLFLTPLNKHLNRKKPIRLLEIGPGRKRVSGFETLNVVGGRQVDYVADASKRLPFPDNTFDVVYASHILEHIPWYDTRRVLAEWARVVKKGGRLEIWVPDGELICEAILDNSRNKKNQAHLDGWRLRNPTGDPFLWANGRLFYGASNSYPSWHKATFTEASLTILFDELGLANVYRPSEDEYRGGANHGPINLGIFGTKK